MTLLWALAACRPAPEDAGPAPEPWSATSRTCAADLPAEQSAGLVIEPTDYQSFDPSELAWDGGLWVGGELNFTSYSWGTSLVTRLARDGSTDPSFDWALALPDTMGPARIAPADGGGVWVAGGMRSPEGLYFGATLLGLVTPEATWDEGFPPLVIDCSPDEDHVQDLLPTADGLLVLGYSPESPWVRRYLATGEPDLTFGEGGEVGLPCEGCAPIRVAQTPDGSLRVLLLSPDPIVYALDAAGLPDVVQLVSTDIAWDAADLHESGATVAVGRQGEDSVWMQRIEADGSLSAPVELQQAMQPRSVVAGQDDWATLAGTEGEIHRVDALGLPDLGFGLQGTVHIGSRVDALTEDDEGAVMIVVKDGQELELIVFDPQSP